MRRAGFVLVVSLTALAASAVFAATRPAPAPAPVSSAPTIRVVSFEPAAPAAARESDDERLPRGTIQFAVGEGETALGFTVARVFAARGDAPSMPAAADLSAVQVGGVLDLRSWERAGNVPDDGFIQTGLIVRCADGSEETRETWTRLSPSQAFTTRQVVEPQRRRVLDVLVTTAAGAPVPGALVGLDPEMMLQPGLVTLFERTGEDGCCRFSGLEADARYQARLLDGVGPDKTVVSARVDAAAKEVVLATKLQAGWEFVRHRAAFAFPGASTRLDRVEPVHSASASAWAVSPWTPPGRGLAAPFWLMLRADGDPSAAVPAKLTFAEREPVDVADVRRPCDLIFLPTTRAVSVAVRDAKPTDGPR